MIENIKKSECYKSSYLKEKAKQIIEVYNSDTFVKRRKFIKDNRDFVMGKIDIESTHGDYLTESQKKMLESGLATPYKVANNIIKIAVSNIVNRKMTPKVNAIDPKSVSKKDKAKESFKVERSLDGVLGELSQETGIDINPPKSLPMNENEIDEWVEVNNRLPSEIAIENFLHLCLSESEFDLKVSNQLAKNLVVDGIFYGCTDVSKRFGIFNRTIDPYNVVHDYTISSFIGDDLSFFGEVGFVDINELMALDTQNAISEDGVLKQDFIDKYRKISGTDSETKRYDEGNVANANIKGKFNILKARTIEVSKFYKKTKKLETEGRFRADTSNAYNPDTDGWEYDDIEIKVKCDFIYLKEFDVIIHKEIDENFRDVKDVQNVTLGIVGGAVNSVMDMKLNSMIGDVRPIVKEIEVLNFKIKHLYLKARPKGLEINVDSMLAAIDSLNAKGIEYEFNDLIKQYLDTGNMLTSNLTEEGDKTYTKPLMELQNGLGSEFMSFLNLRNAKNNELISVVGFNPLLELKDTDVRTLNGQQKMLADIFITSLKEEIDLWQYGYKKLCMNSVSLLKKINTSPFLSEFYKKAIGSNFSKYLKGLKDASLADLGIILELDMTEDERVELEKDIDIAVGAGLIDVSVKHSLRNIKNLKNAVRILSSKITEGKEKIQQMRIKEEQAKAQADQQATVVKEQEKQRTMQMELEVYKQKKLIDLQFEQGNLNNKVQEYALKGEIEDKKITRQENFRQSLKDQEEEGKSKRQLQAIVANSNMIDQRKGTRGTLTEEELDKQKAMEQLLDKYVI